MHDYEQFLRVLSEKNVSNYHFADVYNNASFLLKNDHLRKEVNKLLLGNGISTEVATKLITLSSSIPMTWVLLLIIASIFLAFCGLWFFVICLFNERFCVHRVINSNTILIVPLLITFVYAIYIFALFAKINMLNWTTLLSNRMMLLYFILAFDIIILVFKKIVSRNG